MSALTGSRAAVERAGIRPAAMWLGATLTAASAGAAWLAAGEPAGPACLFRELTHLDCPTCGMTRALTLLARGEWWSSLLVHPGAAALLVQLLAAWLAWARWLVRGGRSPERWIPAVVLANGAAFLTLWVVRLATGMLPR